MDQVIASLSHMRCPNCKNDFQIFKSMLVDELQLCPYCIQLFSAAVGQQNSIPDMQQQQQRLLSQQNNLSIQQQQSQQQMMSNLFPSQGQQSQQQSQQQMMSQIQSQLGQLQQQLGMQQQQPNPLQRDMQQRLGTLLQQQNVIDQQKQLFQSQRVILEASSRGLCCCDVVRRYCCDVAGDLSFISYRQVVNRWFNMYKEVVMLQEIFLLFVKGRLTMLQETFLICKEVVMLQEESVS